MIRFKLSTLIPGLIFPILLNGQYSGFDLSKYKLPDIKTNRLDLNFNLSNNRNVNILRITDLDTTEEKANSFYGSLNLNYYHFRNLKNYQGDLVVVANFSPYIYTNNTNNRKTKDNSINSNFLIQSNNIFFNEKMSFIEINPAMSYSATNDRSHTDYSSGSIYDYNDASFATNISFPVSIGHGRIEPVEDARLAIYILEELTKAGRISDLPADDVIIEMAKEISRIKRSRFFDSRIRKIKELQVIDSFLVANKLISQNDINYFAVLNDQWDYAFGPPRESGFAVSLGFDNNIAFNKLYHEQNIFNNGLVAYNSKEMIAEAGGFLKFRYAKPINLLWQTSADFLTSYNLQFNRNPEDRDNLTENFRTNIFRTSLNYSLQFLPDSRTSIKFRIEGSIVNSQGERTLEPGPVDYKLSSKEVTLSPSLELYYYISPQLRAQFNSSLYLFKSRMLSDYENAFTDSDQIRNKNRHDFSLNLIYSFF